MALIIKLYKISYSNINSKMAKYSSSALYQKFIQYIFI